MTADLARITAADFLGVSSRSTEAAWLRVDLLAQRIREVTAAENAALRATVTDLLENHDKVCAHERWACVDQAAARARAVLGAEGSTTGRERPVCHCGDYCDMHTVGDGHSPVEMEEQDGPP